ncbi:MAG: molybdenum cofactor biosynthesis protein MoaE [Desulfobacteraceae bacterium]|nr:MAG: molybdenum cofactor biosynthesis protein MoaE [Desulfobacteraceae bacterium]
MDINALIERIKQGPDSEKVGMILCHQGVVRSTSRLGRAVRGLRVEVDRDRLDRVLAQARQRQGIVEVLVQINAGRDLHVGDPVMALVVAGDIRENVISALSATLDAIKSEVTRKTEFFVD